MFPLPVATGGLVPGGFVLIGGVAATVRGVGAAADATVEVDDDDDPDVAGPADGTPPDVVGTADANELDVTSVPGATELAVGWPTAQPLSISMRAPAAAR